MGSFFWIVGTATLPQDALILDESFSAIVTENTQQISLKCELWNSFEAAFFDDIYS